MLRQLLFFASIKHSDNFSLLISNSQRLSMSQTPTLWTAPLILSCLIAAFSASFMFGYGIGGPNQYARFTEAFLDWGESNEKSGNFIKELRNGIGQTLFVLGNFVGAITTPYWTNYCSCFTRKSIFYLNYSISIIYALMILLAQYVDLPGVFYLARLFNGYQGGMACVIVPPYLNEISPQSLRGKTGTLHQLAITTGILAAQIVGIPSFLGRENTWSIGFALGSVTSILALFLAPTLMVESPNQLLSAYRTDEVARRTLRRLRQTEEEVEIELQAMTANRTTANETKSLSMIALVTDKNLRWQLITTLVLMTVQALCGINAVFFYSGKMFTTAGIPEAWLPYTAVCTGLINVVTTIAVIPLIDRVGRRPLLLYPMSAMVFIFVGLVGFVELNSRYANPTVAMMAVFCIIGFIVCFAMGLGPIPFIYACEVFRPEARDAALSLSLCFNYLSNIALCLLFPAINAALRGYVFVGFAIIILTSVVILKIKMPETRNRSIEQITQDFHYSTKVEAPEEDMELDV